MAIFIRGNISGTGYVWLCLLLLLRLAGCDPCPGRPPSVKAWVGVLDDAAPGVAPHAPVGLQPNSAVLDIQLLQTTTRPGHGGHTDVTDLT